MNSDSDSETEILETSKRKKGVINSEKYKRNIIKNAKVRGESYINYAGKEIHEKLPATICTYVHFLFLLLNNIIVLK